MDVVRDVGHRLGLGISGFLAPNGPALARRAAIGRLAQLCLARAGNAEDYCIRPGNLPAHAGCIAYPDSRVFLCPRGRGGWPGTPPTFRVLVSSRSCGWSRSFASLGMTA